MHQLREPQDCVQPGEPAYSRIKRYVLDRVARGAWQEGDRVPSESDLMRLFGVSRMTAHRALRELTSTKTGRVETVDELNKRIEDASRFIDVGQLALSPQCGFASGIAGNLLSETEQWAKLDMMMQTARQIWGTQ